MGKFAYIIYQAVFLTNTKFSFIKWKKINSNKVREVLLYDLSPLLFKFLVCSLVGVRSIT